MSIGIARCNSPAADPVHEASFNNDIPIPCHTRQLLTFRTERCHIDPTVVHVLIVDIPMDIMDPQIPKCDAVPHPFVLSHHSHTGTVHFLTQAIALSRDHAAFIRDLQILDHNMLCIVQKHCRRYIAVIHMANPAESHNPDTRSPVRRHRSAAVHLLCRMLRSRSVPLSYRCLSHADIVRKIHCPAPAGHGLPAAGFFD